MKKLFLILILCFLTSCSEELEPAINSPFSPPQLIQTLNFTTTGLSVVSPSSTPLNVFLASGDLDQDGLDDIIMGGIDHYSSTKSPLKIFKNNGNGSVIDMTASLLTGISPIEFYQPQVHIADLNDDGKNDLIIFDRGPKSRTLDGGFMGGIPMIFLSQPTTSVLSYSSTLSDAISNYRQTFLNSYSISPLNCNGSKYYYKWHSENDCDVFTTGDNKLNDFTNGNIHSKYQSLGDVDADGDLDIFIEAGGGFGNPKYGIFMINDGQGNFSASWDRISDTVLKNNVGSQYGTWRHYDNEFVDIDNDGDQDLIIGKLGNKLTSYNFDHNILKSKVLINDGTGHFPDNDVVELVNPDMLDGAEMQYATVASAITVYDLNDDGLKDIIIAHSRGSDALNLGQTEWSGTGRYIQILIQTSLLQFTDRTSDYFHDQSSFTDATLRDNYPSPYAGIEFHNNNNKIKKIKVVDFDNDGDLDFIFEHVGHMETQKGHVGFINDNGFYKAIAINEFQYPARFYLIGEGLGFVDLNQDNKLDIILSGPFDSPNPQNLLFGLYIFIQ